MTENEMKQKKTKRDEFAEHKQATLDGLDLVVNNGALYFHADTDPACYYRLAANDPGIYGLLNDATGEDLTPREQDELLQGIIRHAMDPRNLDTYRAEEAPPAVPGWLIRRPTYLRRPFRPLPCSGYLSATSIRIHLHKVYKHPARGIDNL